jgi:hypothetical protein
MLEVAGRVGSEKIDVFLKTESSEGLTSDDELLRALTQRSGRVFGRV